jgi:hypothetical protein
MRLVLILSFIYAFLFGIEPIQPMVGYIDKLREAVLTNNGKTLVYLNDEGFEQKIHVVNLADWSSQSKQTARFSYMSKLYGTNQYYVNVDRDITTFDPSQFLKGIRSNQKGNYKTYITNNYLFKLDNKTQMVERYSLPNLEKIDEIQLPTYKRICNEIFTDSMIYFRDCNFKNDKNYLINIETNQTHEITDQFKLLIPQWLFSDGSYIIEVSYYGHSAHVFNTKTLERDHELENFLISHPKIELVSQYDNNKALIINETHAYIWDMASHQVIQTIELPKMDYARYIHQNETLAIYSVFKQPVMIVNLQTGIISSQPFALTKPFGVYIENDLPKAILPYENNRVGIWNLFTHKWEYIFPEGISNQYLQYAFKEGNNFFFVFGDVFKYKNKPIMQWNMTKQTQFEYQTDKNNNEPDKVILDTQHSKLLMSFYDKFYIYDFTNGQKLYEFQGPDDLPSVYDLKISEDGKNFLAYTKYTQGYIRYEGPKGAYNYEYNASIYKWSLADQTLQVLPNYQNDNEITINRTYGRRSQKHLKAETKKFEILWDEEKQAFLLKRKDNPYKFIHLYTPQNTSEWIDIDTDGHFDSSKGGLHYLFNCQENNCKPIDKPTINYFKQPDIVKQFLKT